VTTGLAAPAVLADALVAQNVFFVVIAAVMVVAAVRVVTTKNIVHAALYLVVVLAGVAALFVLTMAEFTAATQVLIYIGAVIVLFLFGIMLTRAPMHPKESLDNDLRWPGLIVSLFLAGVLAALLVDTYGADKVDPAEPIRTAAVTNSVFRTYIIPFEVVGVLLLGALIGAVVLARKD
jgi:NADH-quinone oxidoreductase subunit J